MESISLQERNISMLTEEKMLLVDGDEGIRKSLSSFFGAGKCHFHTVENATKALIAIKKEPYDIILCEEFLPDMNGLTFFKIINSKCYKAIKILISLYGNNTTFEDIEEKGIDYLLTKPFSGDEVEATVVRLIKSRCNKNLSNYAGKQRPSK
ncbi:MAG: response regulator [Desulfobulbaceae bacterium]|nr:response regulator [Desulfobulbaceae bacterium]